MAEVVAAWLANYVLHSTLLSAVAWLISRLVSLEPTTREVAWRLALLGGLVTATGVVAGQSFVSRPTPAGPPMTPVLAATGSEMTSWLDQSRGPRALRLRGDAPSATPECRSAVRALISGASNRIDSVQDACGGRTPTWYSTAALIWLLGAAICVGFEAWRRRGLREVFKSLAEPGPEVADSLARLSEETGVRVPRAGCSPLLSSPSVLPGNVLALPMRCADDLPADELRAAIAHELAHVVRRDVQWLGLFRFVAALCWIQPLNRLAVRKLQEAAESACDDWAISHTGEPLALARSISAVVQWSQVGGGVSVPISMTGEGESLTERIGRILGDRPRLVDPAWMHAAIVLALGVPVAVFPTLPVPERPPATVVVQVVADLAHIGEVGQGSEVMERRVVVARFRRD